MFTIFRQKRNFVILRIDHLHHFVVVEDLLSGLKIEVYYGDRELEIAEFIEEYELRFYYIDGSEKSINLLMQGCSEYDFKSKRWVSSNSGRPSKVSCGG